MNHDDENLERIRKSIKQINRIFEELKGEIMKNDRRSRDQKIADALAKQGANGSPYATYRHQPTGGQGFWGNPQQQPSLMKELLDEEKKPEYYSVDNLIYPIFEKRKKAKLTVNHKTGKISGTEEK